MRQFVSSIPYTLAAEVAQRTIVGCCVVVVTARAHCVAHSVRRLPAQHIDWCHRMSCGLRATHTAGACVVCALNSSLCLPNAWQQPQVRHRRCSRPWQVHHAHAHSTVSFDQSRATDNSWGRAAAAGVLTALLAAQPACADVGELFTRNCAGDLCCCRAEGEVRAHIAVDTNSVRRGKWERQRCCNEQAAMLGAAMSSRRAHRSSLVTSGRMVWRIQRRCTI